MSLLRPNKKPVPLVEGTGPIWVRGTTLFPRRAERS